jgi:hypothetical protein
MIAFGSYLLTLGDIPARSFSCLDKARDAADEGA